MSVKSRSLPGDLPAHGAVCWIVPRNLPVHAPDGYAVVGPPLHLKRLSSMTPSQEVTSASFRASGEVDACLLVSSVLLRVLSQGRMDIGTTREVSPRQPTLLVTGTDLQVTLSGIQRWTGEVFVWPLQRVSQ